MKKQFLVVAALAILAVMYSFTATSAQVAFDLQPVPGDYDGDGVTDVAVFAPGPGVWYVKPSSLPSHAVLTMQWGTTGDIPAQGDYDGDGKTDFAVYRNSDQRMYILYSSGIVPTNLQWPPTADDEAIE
jgi:hypothetical protein